MSENDVPAFHDLLLAALPNITSWEAPKYCLKLTGFQRLADALHLCSTQWNVVREAVKERASARYSIT
jgi:hypothetical protein